VRTWSARSTTATEAALAALLLLGPVSPAAAGGLERLTAALARYAPDTPALSAGALAAACGADALCAARRVVALWPERARLERVRHPDTDAIRLARVQRSVTVAELLPSGRLRIALDRFGRRATSELLAAARRHGGASLSAIELDLRRNAGGDLGRALRVAALFIGTRPGAVRLHGARQTTRLDLPPPRRRLPPVPLIVLIGPDTASSAEVLAALLRRHAGARLVGARPAGKDSVQRIVPVAHDFRLWLPAGRLDVAGEDLARGLRPDVPCVLDDARHGAGCEAPAAATR